MCFLKTLLSKDHTMQLHKNNTAIKISFVVLLLLCMRSVSFAQLSGCPDPAANNFNSTVSINDGSCIYKKASVKPTLNTKLNTAVNETSGLIYWNNEIWTHNDSGGEPALYNIDSTTGKVIRKVTITNAIDVDWEDIAQDDSFLYIGDFGNNANGNRTDLKIYKVKKSDVQNKASVTATLINFSYSDQTSFAAAGSNHTNFDCEALIAYNDSLFLFSKDWIDNKTRLYILPKKPGTYTAVNIGELNVQGLITGADIIPDKRVIVLTGYNASVSPFVYLLYDFTGNHFFDANKRKVSVSQSFLQMEGICAVSDTKWYISNERLQQIIVTPAKLQTLNLSSFLQPYYSTFLMREGIPRYTFKHH